MTIHKQYKRSIDHVQEGIKWYSLDKVIYSYFSIKSFVVDTLCNCPTATILMDTQNEGFYVEWTVI